MKKHQSLLAKFAVLIGSLLLWQVASGQESENVSAYQKALDSIGHTAGQITVREDGDYTKVFLADFARTEATCLMKALAPIASLVSEEITRGPAEDEEGGNFSESIGSLGITSSVLGFRSELNLSGFASLYAEQRLSKREWKGGIEIIVGTNTFEVSTRLKNYTKLISISSPKIPGYALYVYDSDKVVSRGNAAAEEAGVVREVFKETNYFFHAEPDDFMADVRGLLEEQGILKMKVFQPSMTEGDKDVGCVVAVKIGGDQ